VSKDDDHIAESGREQSADAEDAPIEEHILELSDRDMDALLAALASPPEPNEAMLRSIQRWRECGSPVCPPSPNIQHPTPPVPY